MPVKTRLNFLAGSLSLYGSKARSWVSGRAGRAVAHARHPQGRLVQRQVGSVGCVGSICFQARVDDGCQWLIACAGFGCFRLGSQAQTRAGGAARAVDVKNDAAVGRPGREHPIYVKSSARTRNFSRFRPRIWARLPASKRNDLPACGLAGCRDPWCLTALQSRFDQETCSRRFLVAGSVQINPCKDCPALGSRLAPPPSSASGHIAIGRQ